MNALRSLTKVLVLNTGYRPVHVEGKRYIKRWVAATHKEITKRKRQLPPQPKPIRSNFLEWNRNAEIFAFNERLHEKFDTALINRALIHRSYIIKEEENQRKQGIEDPKLDIKDNRDLIERGKEFTSKVVQKYLSETLPSVPKHGIMAFHDYLLSEESLATASLHIGTTDLILTAEHPVVNETLANTFLALVAALIESVNANHAAIFVRDFLITLLADKELASIWSPNEPLKALNDILLKEGRGPPEPRLIAQAGKNTLLAAYHVAVYSDKKFLGSGCGINIQEAKEVAATDALCRIYGLVDSSRPVKFNKVIEMESQ
ncbi:hypothetical protein KPH14_012512 [Odynerus spinipes]|uniref:Large ribosomal subunit protein mL44 n=1 Tax=Odynerus spinipes TaxID=1348599 RepID=A0AAD9VMH8_9HYME|nr:hypothetical protein KPH14_012512 [Odynerus spinipes]